MLIQWCFSALGMVRISKEYPEHTHTKKAIASEPILVSRGSIGNDLAPVMNLAKLFYSMAQECPLRRLISASPHVCFCGTDQKDCQRILEVGLKAE